jgi:L-threonylcarbamoyladenylate synthase
VKIIKHNDLNSAAAVIQNGGVLIYPTDTVWGIGGNALNKTVYNKVMKAKSSPKDTKLIWLLPSMNAVKKYFPDVTVQEQKLLNEKRTTVIVAGVGVRVVKTGWVNKLLSVCGVPLLSTSANLHGEKTAESWRQAAAVFAGKADAVIIGRKIYNGMPSAVVAAENGEVKILRDGGGIQIR